MITPGPEKKKRSRDDENVDWNQSNDRHVFMKICREKKIPVEEGVKQICEKADLFFELGGEVFFNLSSSWMDTANIGVYSFFSPTIVVLVV